MDDLLWCEGRDRGQRFLYEQAVDAVLYDEQVFFSGDGCDHFSRLERHGVRCRILVIGYDIKSLYVFILHRVADSF